MKLDGQEDKQSLQEFFYELLDSYVENKPIRVEMILSKNKDGWLLLETRTAYKED